MTAGKETSDEETIREFLGRGGGSGAEASRGGHPRMGVRRRGRRGGHDRGVFRSDRSVHQPDGRGTGGFLAAMLYDTVGPALLATLEPGQFISTMELKASFLRPVSPGRIVGSGRVAHRDGDIAFLDGFLSDLDGATLATATATARVINMDPSIR